MFPLQLRNICTDIRLLTIFILGVFSGFPYGVLYIVLPLWLTEHDISLTVIGLFTFARIPYSIKYIWAPLIDFVSVPFLNKFWGQRRVWMIISNVLIAVLLLNFPFFNPKYDINIILCLAILLCLFATFFDISYDAYRIEILDNNTQPLGAATSVFGYRVGIAALGAFSIAFNEYNTWQCTYWFVASWFIMAAIFNICLIKNVEHFKGPKISKKERDIIVKKNLLVLIPFKEFFNRELSIKIFMMVMLYKLGEAMLCSMLLPFYLEIGFSKTEIATITKILGFFAAMIGGYIGGWIMMKKGYFQALLICGIGQMLSNLSFITLTYTGPKILYLMTVIIIENVTGGMGTAALVGYLGYLCHRKYTATQYAFFSAVASLANNTITGASGFIVDLFDWNLFFIFTTLISLPALILIYRTKSHIQ